MVASAGVDFGHLAIDEGSHDDSGDDGDDGNDRDDGGVPYWREQRPTEDGRGVIVRHHDGTNEDVTPDDANVRTLVHEYGGGDFEVHDGIVYYARYDDQRVYRQPADGDADPRPITPEPATDRGLRYADFDVTPDGDRLFCVREDHDAMAGAESEEDAAEEPVASIVSLPTDGSDAPQVVTSGHDFYAAPRLSPDGDRLAWVTWDHPRMPWDGTELHVADVADDGTLSNDRVVMGGPDESVFQPEWRSDGVLHAVSDRTGWWNLYRRKGDEWTSYREDAAEYGAPHWLFGRSTYAFIDDGGDRGDGDAEADRVAVVVTRDGQQALELIAPDGSREVPDLPYRTYGSGLPLVRSDGESVYAVASAPSIPDSVVRWRPGDDPEVLRRGTDVDLDTGYVSTPEHVTVPTGDGKEAYAYVYPPTNPDVDAPEDELPPLVEFVHGGPTGSTHPGFALAIQFFTSRGFAVADVNYRGSAGYGRAYREALYGEWGLADVEDCVAVARALADEGRVDGDRMAIRGGSAGGFAVLAALAFHDDLAAGASYYGVADLERLAELTHKFESRYLDQLVGPYPDDAATYRDRSPVHHADAIDVPVLVLQGAEDQVVPLSQAEEMVDTLEANGVPHELLVFEGEQHGFRTADARRRAHEAELAFYGEVFGFDPADDLPAIDLSSGDGT
jgi:dipeptidyl aminopeptidase/acylaminoacyl peptidase